MPQIKGPWAIGLILISVSIGGLIGARRGEGFSANLGTELRVALFLPVRGISRCFGGKCWMILMSLPLRC